jgi:predicted TPR repeat methyltransferase
MATHTVKQRKKHAMTLLQAGHVVEAKHILEAVVRDSRHDAGAWHLLSACHGILENHMQSESCARQAISLKSGFSGAWSNLGSALRALGRLDEAESALREAIKLAPDDAIAHNNLGSVYRQQKNTNAAKEHFSRALEIQPGFPDAITNLGLIMQDHGNLGEAQSLHLRALAVDPHHADAYYNLGHFLLVNGDPAAAVPLLQRYIQLKPDVSRGWIALGSAYMRVSKTAQVEQCYRKGMTLDPENADNYSALGVYFLSIGEREKGISTLSHASELRPDDQELRFWLAAGGVGDVPDKMDPTSVTKLFDDYADSFDAQLVGNLEYGTPELIAASLRRTRTGCNGPLAALDLGCGTGLLGLKIRDLVDYLAGVDLSPKMIRVAESRGIYDILQVQDIIAGMECSKRKFDAVLSADVFVYLGDLSQVFDAVRKCLTPAGLFIFSVEAHSGPESWILRPTGRYAHSLAYLRNIAEQFGFNELETEEVVLRKERGNPVNGNIIALRRHGSASVQQ